MSETDHVQQLTERQKGFLPDHLGLEWLEARPGYIKGRFDVRPHHLAPNTFLHAASVIALADSACGYGCIVSRPEGALNFTTIELKSNFLGTTREGGVSAAPPLKRSRRDWSSASVKGMVCAANTNNPAVSASAAPTSIRRRQCSDRPPDTPNPYA